MTLDGALVHTVTTQLAGGASAALSPTGYIRAEDAAALKAAAREITALADPRVVFAVPIDVVWLRGETIGQLIAVLSAVPGAKAIMLGGQMDPLGQFKGAVANLCLLLAQVPDVALLRADHAAFGALAHGAAFAAFGMGSSQRHTVPPVEDTASHVADQLPERAVFRACAPAAAVTLDRGQSGRRPGFEQGPHPSHAHVRPRGARGTPLATRTRPPRPQRGAAVPPP